MTPGPSLPKGLPYTCAGCDAELWSSRAIHHIDDNCDVYCENCAPQARSTVTPTTN